MSDKVMNTWTSFLESTYTRKHLEDAIFKPAPTFSFMADSDTGYYLKDKPMNSDSIVMQGFVAPTPFVAYRVTQKRGNELWSQNSFGSEHDALDYVTKQRAAVANMVATSAINGTPVAEAELSFYIETITSTVETF